MPSPSSIPTRRAKKIFEEIDEDSNTKVKPEAILLANAGSQFDASFFYASAFPYGLFEGSSLVARRDGSVSVLVPLLEEAIARSHSKGLEVHTFENRAKYEEKLKKIIGNDIKTLGINSEGVSLAFYQRCKSLLKKPKFVDVSEPLQSARLVKDQIEIEAIQRACDVASAVYKKIPSVIKDGVTEREVAAFIAYEMQKSGGTGVSFETIVAFGKNSALPHYSAGPGKLKKGQFSLLDYGTTYNRYCSDITRTLVYGRASAKQKRMYTIVRNALEVGTEMCDPSNTGAEVHSKVAGVIDSTEFKGMFIHSTGHSLGLEVHDGPGLSNYYKKNLKPGMVVTVEPGIYEEGFGGVRIEDDVLITKGKPKVLTSAARELIEVD